MNRYCVLWLLALLPFVLMGQNTTSPSSAADRLSSIETKKGLLENSIVNTIEFENIGPTIFSGRVTDIAVHPEDPSIFYVAYASGGLWKTTNNGTTFSPIFDNEAVMTIGDIAVDWKNNIIWLGSGENNSSRSSYAGLGMFKSLDDGKTWQHIGLSESHHISRIILDPTNKDIAYVAVLGHLYSANEERGVYKTIDGGATWKKTLYVNENSGAVDLLSDPLNVNTLYAATWERSRRAHDFLEAGEGSGIYKSTDAGETWKKLNTPTSGFPFNEGTGRIGLAIYNDGTNSKLYALLDNYNRRPKKEKEKTAKLSKNDFKEMSKEDFLNLKTEKLADFLKANNFPEKYSAKKVIKLVKSDKIEVASLAEYLESANSLLFDTPVIGAEVYVSEDGGKSWSKTHENYLDRVYNSYGYYFGQIRVAEFDQNKIYIMGVPILRSDDGGFSWESIGGSNVHADHHALWVNPKRKGHLINGNDGGINISYDDGKTWIKNNSPSVGQFYYINVDNAKPYNVYGGLQDNGVWMGSHDYRSGNRWHSTGQYPYKSIMGGDGMQVQIDNRDNTTVYTGYQFGNYFRINTKTGRRKYITPKHELGDRPYRFNWQTPILLSPHNQDILYLGGNKLLRSMNQGNTFKEISKDLTGGGKKGDVAFGTLTSLDESIFEFGLLYTGSDDGKVFRSKDGGVTWDNINVGLPADHWVSRIQASKHEASRVYVSLNGYRTDNFAPYLFVSDDYGDTWRSLSSTLPHEAINVIKEDPINENILYVGTDHGLYVSLNQGTSFMQMNNGLPAVPVHDVVIQKREQDLLIGTHGRSIYLADIAPLQKMDPSFMAQDLYTFQVEPREYNASWGKQFSFYRKPKDPKQTITFYTNMAGTVEFKVFTEDGKVLLFNDTIEASKGLNYYTYHLDIHEKSTRKFNTVLKSNDKKSLKISDTKRYFLPKGKYQIELTRGAHRNTTILEIK